MQFEILIYNFEIWKYKAFYGATFNLFDMPN